MDDKFKKLVQSSVFEPQTYDDKISCLIQEIENKKNSIRTLCEENKKLMLANWLFKIKRRSENRKKIKVPQTQSLKASESVDKVPFVIVLLFFFCLVCYGVSNLPNFFSNLII
jgi:regulator of replication initiation timing